MYDTSIDAGDYDEVEGGRGEVIFMCPMYMRSHQY